LALVLLLMLGTLWDLWCAAHNGVHAGAGAASGPEAIAARPDSARAPASEAPADAASADRGTPQAAPATAEKSGRGKRPPAQPLDLNTADAEALHQLPGVGPVLASRIVAYRRANGAFGSVDELRAVRGIGPRLFERIRHYVRTDR
jgi:competence ComEA-like helix-hairpin-helix protein